MERPDWWNWPLAFTAHVELRMEERGFSEGELRAMLEGGTELLPSKRPGRWLIRTRHAGTPWGVVVEPDDENRILMLVTAYRRSMRS